MPRDLGGLRLTREEVAPTERASHVGRAPLGLWLLSTLDLEPDEQRWLLDEARKKFA